MDTALSLDRRESENDCNSDDSALSWTTGEERAVEPLQANKCTGYNSNNPQPITDPRK